MAVYLDGTVLVCQSTQELVEFAILMGLDRQKRRKRVGRLPHYTLTLEEREQAVRFGAIPISPHEATELAMASRRDEHFDLAALREHGGLF
jgi:hypothetical protein